jgi:hypothetical protein
MHVDFYYDFGKVITSDPDGCLVMLCEECAAANPVEFAAQGDADSACELCDAPQDAEDDQEGDGDE